QWVAVSSSGSGVISLTSSDNEDEGRARSKGKTPAPAPRPVDPQPQPPRRRGYFSAVPVAAPAPTNSVLPTVPDISNRSDAEQQAVHLLRESVASLLSSTGSAASSTVSSAQPQSLTAAAAPVPERGVAWRRRSQSPSNVSKISEPCYATSAPRRQFTADFDHFSDIALSAVAATAPPSHQRSRQPESHRPAALLPTYDEFKHRVAAQPPLHEEFKHREPDQPPLNDADIADVYMPPTIPPSSSRRPMPAADPSISALPVSAESQDSSAASLRRRAMGSAGMSGSSAAATTVVASEAVPGPAAYHPLLADPGSPRAQHDMLSIYSASRSPFASIRTVSPVIVAEGNSILQSAAAIDQGAVARARAEAALERTILCPMSRTVDNS
ncbi:hypothetical protein H4R20_006630, partial [Coemansia guatemalensis]